MRDGFATGTIDPREIWVLAHLVRSPESLPDAFHVSHGWEAPSEEVISNREGVCTFVDQALENAGRGLGYLRHVEEASRDGHPLAFHGEEVSAWSGLLHGTGKFHASCAFPNVIGA